MIIYTNNYRRNLELYWRQLYPNWKIPIGYHVHHIMPISLGGTHHPSNLIALHIDDHVSIHKCRGDSVVNGLIRIANMKHTAKTKLAIGRSRKGTVMTATTKKKLSDVNKNKVTVKDLNKPNKGCFKISKTDPDYIAGKYVGCTHGAAMPTQTQQALLKANTGRPCPEIVKHKNSERNKLSSNPWRKENRKGLLGNEFTSETARACALKRVAEGRHNFQNSAENHPQFKGYYCTPKGKFVSAPKAVYDKLSAYDIRYYCDNSDTIITQKRAIKSPVLTDADIGKTFKEIGFWFEEIV
jgi:hypothetical protein